jgi:hypothetical protein
MAVVRKLERGPVQRTPELAGSFSALRSASANSVFAATLQFLMLSTSMHGEASTRLRAALQYPFAVLRLHERALVVFAGVVGEFGTGVGEGFSGASGASATTLTNAKSTADCSTQPPTPHARPERSLGSALKVT